MKSFKDKFIKFPIYNYNSNPESFVFLNPNLIVTAREHRVIKNQLVTYYTTLELSTNELDIENDGDANYVIMNTNTYNVALSFEELSNLIDQWNINKKTNKYIEGVINE